MRRGSETKYLRSQQVFEASKIAKDRYTSREERSRLLQSNGQRSRKTMRIHFVKNHSSMYTSD